MCVYDINAKLRSEIEYENSLGNSSEGTEVPGSSPTTPGTSKPMTEELGTQTPTKTPGNTSNDQARSPNDNTNEEDEESDDSSNPLSTVILSVVVVLIVAIGLSAYGIYRKNKVNQDHIRIMYGEEEEEESVIDLTKPSSL
jgi:hypothetical protein